MASVRPDLPGVAHVWSIDDGAVEALADAGSGIGDEEIERRRQTLTPDSLATIIYTSGTTGRPKGCELTHGNFLAEAHSVVDSMREMFNENGSTLLFLPLAHVFARMIEIGTIYSGVRLGHTADVKNLLPDLAVFQPTFILSVPRVFEKVYNSSAAKAEADGQGQDLPPRRRHGDRLLRGPRQRRPGAGGASSSTRSSTGSSTASCAPPSAAACSTRSPAALRSARAWGTSTAASASPSSRATA